MLLEENPKAKG